MGVYIYTARSPKTARMIEVKWQDGTHQAVRALALGYAFKPWTAGRGKDSDRDLKRLWKKAERAEQAWIGLEVPRYAVEVHERNKDRIAVGDTVIAWGNREHAPLVTHDDPDFGGATEYGKVVTVFPERDR